MTDLTSATQFFQLGLVVLPRPATFREAVLSLKLAREELLAGRISLGAFYEHIGAALEVAVDHLVELEGLELAPTLLRRNQHGLRRMFATPGMVKLYFTQGIGRRLAKVLKVASKNVYGHARQGVTASTMLIWLPVVDFCRALSIFYKAYCTVAPARQAQRSRSGQCTDSRVSAQLAPMSRQVVSRRRSSGLPHARVAHVRGCRPLAKVSRVRRAVACPACVPARVEA